MTYSLTIAKITRLSVLCFRWNELLTNIVSGYKDTPLMNLRRKFVEGYNIEGYAFIF